MDKEQQHRELIRHLARPTYDELWAIIRASTPDRVWPEPLEAMLEENHWTMAEFTTERKKRLLIQLEDFFPRLTQK